MSKKTYRKNKTKLVDESLRLDPDQVSSVIKSLRLYFLYQDNPPADQIIVYPQTVCLDEDSPDHVTATVKLVKDYCGVKSHVVYVKFKVNKQFHCIADSLRFV